MFRTLTAKYPGTCRRCHQPISVGQKIRYGGRGLTYHMAAYCGGATGSAHGASDPADEAERRYFRNFDADYQREVQGFVSSP